MVTAFVMIKLRRDRIQAASQEILNIDGVAEVYSVAGDCDVVAVVRVRENDHLARLVTEDMIAVDGIIDTRTLIAFRQYSRYDLEHMFGLGVE
ncbi:MAG: Lrp/AsnC family transcriptional regulator [Planctomycetes bacterium]|nr:Lrp/AsnC family transcriptional regulator [Planctomycetota bacterium]